MPLKIRKRKRGGLVKGDADRLKDFGGPLMPGHKKNLPKGKPARRKSRGK